MANLKLTDVERLLLANQYDILGLLKKEDGYTKMAENLRDGHKWIYEQDATYISDNLPDDDANHVLTILGIYSDLRYSYKQLSDKSGIDEHALIFPGFDGNNEAELRHFAHALSKNGRYIETVGRDARNSHMPTTDMYRRQISEWKNLGSPKYPFSKEQVEKIIDARTHPANPSEALHPVKAGRDRQGV